MRLLLLFLITNILWGGSLKKDHHTLKQKVIDNWNSRNGLPQNSVTSIVEQGDGYLWLGTEEGLVRFDGTLFKIFDKNFFNEPDHFITQLYPGGDQHHIWIVFRNQRVVYFNIKNHTFHPVVHPERGDYAVTQLIRDPAGKLWCGTKRMGICEIKDLKLECRGQQIFASNLTIGPEGGIWFNRGAGKIARFLKDKITHRLTLPGHQIITTLFWDRNKVLYIGTLKEGIRTYHPGGLLTPFMGDHFQNDAIHNILRDRLNNLWIMTRNNGLYRLTDQLTIDPQNHLNIPYIRPHLIDQRGNIWLGSQTEGLYRLSSGIFTSFSPGKDQKRGTGISIFQTKKGKLLLGTFFKGIFTIARNTLIPLLPDQKITGSVNSITEDSKGNIYLSLFSRGITKLTPGGTLESINELQKIQLSTVLFVDRDDHLWIATINQGIYRYHPEKPLKHFKFQTGGISSISEKASGELWLGTEHGVYRYQDEKFHKIFPEINWTVHDIHHTPKRLYIATTRGLYILEKGGTALISLTSKNGLPDDKLFGVVEDQTGRLWLSSNHGIFSLDQHHLSRFLQGEQQVWFDRYGPGDGLNSLESTGGTQYNLYRDRSGKIWFATLGGFSLINPDDLKQPAVTPKIKLTTLQLDYNRVIHLKQNQKEITISPDTRRINLHYHASSYLFPRKIKYRYRLKGLDPEWIAAGEKQEISYNTLPPGRYLLEIIATDSRGRWGRSGTSLSIMVTTPFYQKTAFYIVLWIVFLLLISILFKWRIYSVQKENIKLEKLVAERTREIQELSLKDPLTGLFNRRFMNDVLKKQINAFITQRIFLNQNKSHDARRDQNEAVVYGIFLFDIDHFKQVNDTLGHDAGDQVIKAFSAILTQSVRQDDIVIRWGGEEFLVILKETDPAFLTQFARMVKRKIEQHRFETGIEDQILHKTASIGFASYPFYQNQPELISLEQVIHLADLGLYHSKQNGRNMAVHILPGKEIPEEHTRLNQITTPEELQKSGFVDLEIN